MDSPQNDFGRALSVDAEAIGQPGQRRFRLLVSSSNQSASVWLEKDQLASIGAWLTETIERLDKERPTSDPDVEPLPFPETFDLDFRASHIGLGFIEDEEQFAFQAFDVRTPARSDSPFFRCFISRGQSRTLSRKISAVIAGGRPICPLCESPIDPQGHVCPKANGHRAGAIV